MSIKVAQQFDDAPAFIQQVEEAANGILRLHAPETLILIKIDNWFGFKWLGFKGQLFFGRFARLATWHFRRNEFTKEIRIPPFVPERVVSQRRFTVPDWMEIDAGEPVHKKMRSPSAVKRKAAVEAPKTAFAWYTGNSAVNGRGALMAYIPVENAYWAWYAALHEGRQWRLGKTLLIDPDWFAQLKQEGRASLVRS